MTAAVSRPWQLVLLVVLCLSLPLTGSVAAAPAAGTTADPPGQTTALLQEGSTADAGNDTRHQHPDEYSEAGDEDDLERWLSTYLSDRLGESAVEISNGEYELASEYLDAEYRDRLDQYVDVAGGGDGEADDGEADDGNDTAAAFDDARTDQDRLANTLAEYNETKDAYEDARANGDPERARELARELVVLADEIDELSQNLGGHYDAISNTTAADLTAAKDDLNATNQEIQADRTRIRDEEFRDTELTLTSTTTEPISFREPLVATGELRTANGTPIANEEISLAVGNQLIQTETDTTGAFTVDYRPISVPLATESLTIRYVPANESLYFRSEATVSVSIEQVEPTIAPPTVDAERVAYTDELTIESGLHVDNTSVDGVPLAVSLGNESIGVGETTNGTFVGTTSVPAEVPAGEQPLRVRLPFEDRALAGVQTTTPVSVAETDPTLSLSATQTGEREVRVNGTFAAAGSGLEGHSIRLVAAGTPLTTVTTTDGGAFSEVVTLPADSATGEVQLTAVYEDEHTNLAPTEATTTVSFAADQSASGTSSSSSLPHWVWVGLGLVSIAAGGAGVYWYRHATATADDTPPPGNEIAESPSAAQTPSHSLPQRLLAQADDRLAAGDPNSAVQLGYAAVRQALESQDDPLRAATHWEFYRQYHTQLPADQSAETLRAITEDYEVAAFGRADITDRTAHRTLARARELCADQQRPPGQTPTVE